MKRKPTLLELLTHPLTQDAVRSIAQGNDPRGVLAGLAGDLVAQEVAKAIGAKRLAARAPEPKERKAPQPGRAARARVEVLDEGEIIDAEYTVINVTPRGAKKAG